MRRIAEQDLACLGGLFELRAAGGVFEPVEPCHRSLDPVEPGAGAVLIGGVIMAAGHKNLPAGRTGRTVLTGRCTGKRSTSAATISRCPDATRLFAQGVGREAPGRQKDARNARSHAARRADPERVHGRAAQPREATVPKMDSPDAWCKSGLRSGEMRKLAGIAQGFRQSYTRCRIARSRARPSLISRREFASSRLLVCAVFAQSLARFAHKFAWMNSP